MVNGVSWTEKKRTHTRNTIYRNMINLFYGNIDGRETTKNFNSILYELDTHISWAFIDENKIRLATLWSLVEQHNGLSTARHSKFGYSVAFIMYDRANK